MLDKSILVARTELTSLFVELFNLLPPFGIYFVSETPFSRRQKTRYQYSLLAPVLFIGRTCAGLK
jgi:hypothetical protein